MANKPFDEMIKKELVETITFLKLEDKVTEVANNPAKPTNAEYVQVLEAFKASQDTANVEIAKEEVEFTPKDGSGTKKEVTPKATKAEEKAEMVEDLNTGIPVIITDHDTSVTIDEDVEGRTVAVRWGNPIIGMSTTNVSMHGRMQHVPKGAAIRLKKISLASHVKDADGKEKSHRDRKRFSVADTTGWTENEFNSHRDEQRLKKI